MIPSNTELKIDALRRLGISPEPFERTKNEGANSRHHAIENPMRILVYASDSDKEAKQLIEEMRLEGHHASLRNVQFYQGEIEPCDGVVVRHGRSQNVVDAYEAAGKQVRFYGLEETQTVEPAVPASTESSVMTAPQAPAEPKPKRDRRPKVGAPQTPAE